nr:MAG TPA: hypothetical protein [Caudoviricetes sp.]
MERKPYFILTFMIITSTHSKCVYNREQDQSQHNLAISITELFVCL